MSFIVILVFADARCETLANDPSKETVDLSIQRACVPRMTCFGDNDTLMLTADPGFGKCCVTQ